MRVLRDDRVQFYHFIGDYESTELRNKTLPGSQEPLTFTFSMTFPSCPLSSFLVNDVEGDGASLYHSNLRVSLLAPFWYALPPHTGRPWEVTLTCSSLHAPSTALSHFLFRYFHCAVCFLHLYRKQHYLLKYPTHWGLDTFTLLLAFP